MIGGFIGKPIGGTIGAYAAIEGELSVTLASVSQAAASKLIIVGAASQQVDAVSLTAAGGPVITGQASQQVAGATLAATARALLSGVSAQTLDAVTQSARGKRKGYHVFGGGFTEDDYKRVRNRADELAEARRKHLDEREREVLEFNKDVYEAYYGRPDPVIEPEPPPRMPVVVPLNPAAIPRAYVQRLEQEKAEEEMMVLLLAA